MRAILSWVPPGDWGTYSVLSRMAVLARAQAVAPVVREAALSIVQGIPGLDGGMQARAIRAWLAQHVVFVRDPHGIETLHSPVLMIKRVRAVGSVSVDCDDVAVLAAALGTSVGLMARFVTLAFHKPGAPFRHVFCELSDPQRVNWIDCDITRPAQGLPAAISRVHYKRV